MRNFATLVTLAAGVILAAVGYFVLAAPLGGPPSDEGFSNPTVPFATVYFIVGVVLFFLSPIVYEVFPERERKE